MYVRIIYSKCVVWTCLENLCWLDDAHLLSGVGNWTYFWFINTLTSFARHHCISLVFWCGTIVDYLREGGYVFARVCLSVCLSVCVL